MIVDEEMFALGYCKEQFIVQPVCVINAFLEVQFCGDLSSLPIKGCYVSFGAGNESVSSIGGEAHAAVGTVGQLKGKSFEGY